MKIALIGLTGIKTGKHNLKDPRFDEADKLVEADKKTYAQVDVVGEDQLSTPTPSWCRWRARRT